MITGISPTLARGEVLIDRNHQLRVTAVDFTRDAAFPGAVAQVAIEGGRGYDIGAHVETPFGLVQIAADERGFVEEDEDY